MIERMEFLNITGPKDDIDRIIETYISKYDFQLENALSELKKSYPKLPNSKDILDRLDKLQEKKNTLMAEYSSTKSTMDELYRIRKNYGIYMDKEMER